MELKVKFSTIILAYADGDGADNTVEENSSTFFLKPWFHVKIKLF